jgi:NAD(P)-dependent dehydrogenase (short-subunit alcohol dehydrogenase family)
MGKLAGKIALVTGGGTGIGLATARRFVEEGARVFITGRRGDVLAEAAGSIGPEVSPVTCDVADDSDMERLFARISADVGRLDVVVANAGIIEQRLLADVTSDHMDEIFAVNAKSVAFTVQRALPLMPDGGAIVLISSVVHMKGRAAHGVYAASKAAVRSFARTWAVELAPRGIRVNVISPGPIETPIIDPQFSSPEAARAAREELSLRVPLKRFGQPEEIASAALFLASDESSYVNAVDLPVDGGLTQV